MAITLPTWLTLARIAMMPVLVACFYLPAKGGNVIAAFLFVAIALTDWLDGWLARRYGLTSAFGAFLDPVADKLTVTVVLFLIVQQDPTALMAILGAIIVGREISITALREWMATIGRHTHIRVAGLGKFKTIVQMVALTLLLYQHDLWGIPIYEIGRWLLVVAAALTLWSGGIYLRAAWPHMRGDALVAGPADAQSGPPQAQRPELPAIAATRTARADGP
ncbi:MAG: CDP-diacylglycerol--glycerol-3-phosphate 3-phosphatidyltransferase [Xanthomonadales bacterium]|nr:CDP-diacylglycerol--glycerol-3-phosphate 3-phosphatidyltransferase [Xanthomonadales bacterium]